MVSGKVIITINGYFPSYILTPHTALVGRVAFLGCRNASVSEAAVLILDDPYDTNIAEFVEQGYIVRTRADSGYVPGASANATQNNMYYFMVIDIDHSGSVSNTEVESFLTALGVRILSPAIVSSVFNQCSCYGEMNFSQFECGIQIFSENGIVIPSLPSQTQEELRRDKAIASGAHCISTDYPGPPLNVADYYVSIPGTSNTMPYRCNPKNAPSTCTPSDFEIENTTMEIGN